MFRKRVDIDLENVNSNMLEIVMCICDSLNCESKKTCHSSAMHNITSADVD